MGDLCSQSNPRTEQNSCHCNRQCVAEGSSWWEPAEGEFDFMSELQNFSGKIKVEIQPGGPIANKIKKAAGPW